MTASIGSPLFIRSVVAAQFIDPHGLSLIGASLVAALPWLAAYFAYRAFWLKWGISLRGNFVTTSTIACEDDYVSSVTIENAKDRAVTIFAIYLQVGPNLYIVIEHFGDAPLILKGFETVQRNYEPIEYYASGFKRLRIDALLKDRKIDKRLVVSTSVGKRLVRKWIRKWSPTHDFFGNHLTGIVYPMRSTFKGKSFGSNAIFAVSFRLGDGTEQIIPIYRGDHEIKKFRKFALTQESLTSKEALEAFLKQKQSEGLIEVASIEVLDLDAIRQENIKGGVGETINAPRVGLLKYRVIGPAYTWLSNRKLRRQNKMAARSRATEKLKN